MNVIATSIRDEHLNSFAEVALSPFSEAERASRVAAIRERVDRYQQQRQTIIVLADGPYVAAFLHAVPIGDQHFMFHPITQRPDSTLTVSDYTALLQEAIRQVVQAGGTKLQTRLSSVISELDTALEETEFHLVGNRIEYRTELDRLPSEEGSPLTWRTLEEVGLPFAAQMLQRCSIGDPHSAADEDPVEAIHEFLSDTELTTSPDCMQIGYLYDAPVAFICAQVMERNGWSRIAYMGVVPEARGQGLGRWTHRHGFAMLRQQGGKLYHGGTSGDNLPMQHLFLSHGCTEFQRMVEWERRIG